MLVNHNKPTIISMAIIASAFATLLHEGLGHAVTAYLRGDIPTIVTSNHVSTVTSDRVVAAGGTIVNLIVGTISLLLAKSAGRRANLHYFFWIFGALNLLPGAGYFLFSGIFGFGDWQVVIEGLPHYVALRIFMCLFGVALYMLVVRWIAINACPFIADPADYNTVSRLPYYAACIFSCIAGAFDPLGLKLLFISTIPAAFGGSSGLMWGDSYVPKDPSMDVLIVQRSTAWLIAAIVIGVVFVSVLGPGIHLTKGT